MWLGGRHYGRVALGGGYWFILGVAEWQALRWGSSGLVWGTQSVAGWQEWKAPQIGHQWVSVGCGEAHPRCGWEAALRWESSGWVWGSPGP